jgi:hypothetical protein
LEQRRAGALAASAAEPRRLGPVGSRHGGPVTGAASVPLAAAIGDAAPPAAGSLLRAVIAARVKKTFARLWGRSR